MKTAGRLHCGQQKGQELTNVGLHICALKARLGLRTAIADSGVTHGRLMSDHQCEAVMHLGHLK